MSRVWIAAAVIVYLFVVGCALIGRTSESKTSIERHASTRTSATRPVGDLLPIRAIGIQLQRVDWMDKYKLCIDEIADVGADGVKLVIDTRQENGSSSKIFIDQRYAPSADGLVDLIKYAKSKNLRVVVMPIVLLDKPRGGEWRGQIKPESWDAWWNSYRDMLSHFAWLSQSGGADVFVVGSELVSTEEFTDQWRETIEHVRTIFSGLLTYSSNWDHYGGIEWWDDLDLISMNSYWKLGSNKDASVDEIKKNWQKIEDEVMTFARRKKKKLFFTEVGWCSLANAATEPWDYTRSSVKLDLELQARLYEGFFQHWHGNPDLAGFSIWAWDPGEGGVEDRGYTPKNKPAEKVLRDWLAKDAWKVD
ncbi:MAG TPA: hypothetical protein PK402_02610 [Tepidisphaeraceae bacterium]|nr:hypothetical protein [Tepidisphaeraceae bacterium]